MRYERRTSMTRKSLRRSGPPAARLAVAAIFATALVCQPPAVTAADIPAIMSGKQADLPILANDIIIVPNSRIKSVTSTLLKAFGVNSTRIPYR